MSQTLSTIGHSTSLIEMLLSFQCISRGGEARKPQVSDRQDGSWFAEYWAPQKKSTDADTPPDQVPQFE